MIADRNRLHQTKTAKSSTSKRSKLRPSKHLADATSSRSVKDKTAGHHANSSGSVAYSDDCDRSIRMFSDGKHIYNWYLVHILCCCCYTLSLLLPEQYLCYASKSQLHVSQTLEVC
jgi:hypothetical protein